MHSETRTSTARSTNRAVEALLQYSRLDLLGAVLLLVGIVLGIISTTQMWTDLAYLPLVTGGTGIVILARNVR